MHAIDRGPRWGVLLLTIASFCPPHAARADGFAFKSKDLSGLFPLYQNRQLAAIHLHDGVQRMLITINVDLDDDERGLWIFPVPGTANEAHVDLVDQFPKFAGDDLRRQARESIRWLMRLMRATQVYPAPFEVSLSMGRAPHVSVAAAVEKWGLRAEVVDAPDAVALADHLQSTRPGLTAEDLEPFTPYFTDEYVFIVAWLQSRAELAAEFPEVNRRRPSEGRWPTLLVSFPTPTAFYPMKPTSAYGDQRMDVVLYVLGTMEPQTQAGLARILKCRHFEQEAFSADLPAEFTAGLPRNDIPYTRITVSTPARNFVDDIRFTPAELPDRAYIQAIRHWAVPPWLALTWVVATLLLSYLSAGLAGLVVFRRWGRPARLGLWNVFTILGLGLALRRCSLPRPGAAGAPPAEGPKIAFLLLFSLIFVAGTVLAQVALQAPLLK